MVRGLLRFMFMMQKMFPRIIKRKNYTRCLRNIKPLNKEPVIINFHISQRISSPVKFHTPFLHILFFCTNPLSSKMKSRQYVKCQIFHRNYFRILPDILERGINYCKFDVINAN